MNLKRLFHFHKWEIIQDGDYDILGIPTITTIRQCKKCEVKQELIIDCLGLNPAEYYQFWHTLGTIPECYQSNPSSQQQAESCCESCQYRKKCFN